MTILLRVLKKISTKPVWYWERNRPYFSRLKLSKLEQLYAVKQEGVAKVNILCTSNTITEAAFSAWSWANYIGCSFGIRIVVDGSFDKDTENRLQRLVEGIEVREASSLISKDLLAMEGLGEMGRHHPMGRKLLMILSLQRQEDLIYCDNDVLLFNYPSDLMDAKKRNLPAFNQESVMPCYNDDVIKRATELGLRPSQSLNAGLLYCPSNSLDEELANVLASAKDPKYYSWFDEQTIFAYLMQNAEAVALNKTKYVVSTKRQFWTEEDIDYATICTRHFTTPVRHLMYGVGYNYLLQSKKQK